MKLAVCIPSRGLIHSRTIESVEENLKNLDSAWEVGRFFSHDLPIPDAQNDITQRAFDWGADFFWFVEEDNLIYPDTLSKMLEAMVIHFCGAVAVDYPVGEKNYSTVAKKDGKVMWSGFGCTLVARMVFEQLEKPWFRTDVSYKIKGDESKMEFEEVNVINKYGGHDIHFGVSLSKLNIPIYELENTICGHLRVDFYGQRGINNGRHKIVLLDKIENEQNY